jgi:hypothetical protein
VEGGQVRNFIKTMAFGIGFVGAFAGLIALIINLAFLRGLIIMAGIGVMVYAFGMVARGIWEDIYG